MVELKESRTVSSNTAVREWALQSGFDAVGVARAQPVDPETRKKYLACLERGHHASMSYLARNLEARFDPRLVLPGAKSVVVLLKNYWPGNVSNGSEVAKIARYAGGRDYHKVLGKGLRHLARRIENAWPGTACWTSVDSGPVLERYWAEKAGLGWVGKNTLLLTQGLGSWVFLGVMFTTLELEPDTPHPDHCGTCTRCLEACPTEAFPEPGVLDSRRCISYWTIEHKGELPHESSGNLDDWFFGCDDCQTICPWNRHAKPCEEPEFERRAELREPDLREWARIAWEDWDRLTRGTALRRTGYEGFKRNAESLLKESEKKDPEPSRK
jgi:epoxyqueuosine reductase